MNNSLRSGSAARGAAFWHWPILSTIAAIAALGCYNLHSSAAHHNPRLYLTQMTWFALGTIVMGVCLSFDYRATEAIAYGLYAGTIAMLVGVLLIGKSAMGAKRWLVIGPLTFQPSEMAKLSVIFCLARYFSYRVPIDGYSIRALVRPMNPTRPLACAVWLLAKWQKPWLTDPQGELARRVHAQLQGAPPPLEDLLWCRLALLLLLAASFAASVYIVLRIEREAALLHPWPATRKKRLLFVFAGLHIGAGLALLGQWHSPLLADPLGQALTILDLAGGPEGHLALPRERMGPRMLCTAFIALYWLACTIHNRRHPAAWLDLIIAPFDLLAVPSLLVLVQPDLGSAGIIFMVGMTMILVVGIGLRSLLNMSVIGAAISLIAWFAVLKDYQKRRILVFLNPEEDVRGAGWNAVQSLIAVGSGRWFGKGHKNGTQTQLSFLPEQHTDFAFSVWAEEQGFMGCALLLALYLLLISFAVGIAARAREPYGTLLACGITGLLLWQAFINIGMVIGVLPVVGITLPLFSYGGSSVLTVMASIGLLLNIHAARR